MKYAILLMMTVVSSLLGGCAASTDMRLDNASLTTADPAAPAAAADSLFKSDQSVMSNQDIEKVLGSKIYPPDHQRIAIVRIGGRFPWGRNSWWSESVAQIEQQGADRMLTAIRSCPRVGKATMLPTLLTPAQVTIPYLREAAARVQADSLLIYRTYTQSYQRGHFFGGGDVHAFCTVEVILLDVRSGIVTDTAVKSKSFTASKKDSDLEFEETTARAEQQATADALGQAVEELVKNLNAEPMAPTTSHSTTSP